MGRVGCSVGVGCVVGVTVVVSIVVFSIMFICCMGAVPAIAAMGGAADPSLVQIMSVFGAIAVPVLLCTLVLYVVLSVLETFAQAVVVRGVAHWVARYAPEWTTLGVPRC